MSEPQYIALKGKTAEDVRAGEAVFMAVVLYYPNKQKVEVVGNDAFPPEEVRATLRQFPGFAELPA